MSSSAVFRFLPWCAALIFIGRGYGYFFWGSPVRVLVWDEALFSPVVRLFGGEWTAYVTSLRVDEALILTSRIAGVYLMACGGLALAALRSSRRWLAVPLLLGTLLLAGHALLETKDHFYHYAQLFEHAIQVGTPLLLAFWVWSGRPVHLLLAVRTLVALTFAAHGLYAIGFYDVPAHFVDMTIRILGVPEATARQFLWWVGALDLVVAVAVFLPRVARFAFAYAAVWGFLTALARIVYGWDTLAMGESLHGHLYQTILRLPHAGVPLLGWCLLGADAGAKEAKRAMKQPSLTSSKED